MIYIFIKKFVFKNVYYNLIFFIKFNLKNARLIRVVEYVLLSKNEYVKIIYMRM
jgi:hypothetical protein